MEANGPRPILRRVLARAAVALWLGACSSSSNGEPGTISVALSATTEVALFALGPTPSFEPFGGTGTIVAGPPSYATWIARGVPEGPAFLEVVGYAAAPFSAPNPATFPPVRYCAAEVGARGLSVVSGLREAMSLETNAFQGCPHVALDRVWVTAAYVAQPTDRYNGGPRGANIAHLMIDSCGAGAALEIDVAASGGTAPLGLFAALPDVARSERWPDAASWPVAPLAITADGAGDAEAFLVARPEAEPKVWDVEVRGCAGATAYTRLWVSAQGADQGCEAGGCVVVPCPAMAPTGWASSEGGFNSNHAELRCGDDGRGTGGYQLFPGITYDLTAVPAGSLVGRAVMHVYQVRVDGDAPYGPRQQQVEVEQVRYTNMWEVDEVPAVMGTIGRRPLSADRIVGWHAAEVTEAVQAELAAGRSRVQFRLSFAPEMADGDAAIDWAVFASDDSPAPNEALRPWLEVSVLP